MSLRTPTLTRQQVLTGLWPEISLFALLANEWIWTAAVFTAFFNLNAHLPMILLSFAVPGFLGYCLAKILHKYELSKTTQRVILAIWVVAALAFWIWLFALPAGQSQASPLFSPGKAILENASSLQALLLEGIVFLLLMRRSLTLPATTATSWQAVRSSQIGLVMFLVFGLTTAWANFFNNLVPFAVYLFLILISMTTARLAELTVDHGGRSPGFKRSWLISIVLLAAAFVAIACLSGWLVGVVMVNTASAILNFIYIAILVVLLILLSPFLLVLTAAIPILNRLVQNLVANNFGQKQAELILSILQPKPGQGEKVLRFMNSGLAILLGVIALLVLIGVILGVRINRQRQRAESESEISDLAQVQKMLQESRKRSLFSSALDQARRWLASARIRRIYAQLMKACADLNSPRPPSFTPLEFQPQLNVLFPDLVNETTLLTNTYISIRYGEIPETMEEMQQIHDVWEKVRVEASEMIRERKKRMRAGF